MWPLTPSCSAAPHFTTLAWHSQLLARGVPIAQTSKAKGGKQGEVALDSQMFPFARLRRVVAGDPDIHAVSREAVLALGKSVEAFLTALAASAARTAQRRGAKRTVTEADVASTARSVLPFSTVLGVGDFPAERSWGDSAGASTTHERHGAEKSAVAPLARTEGAMGRFMASTGALSREAAFAAAATTAGENRAQRGGTGEPGSPVPPPAPGSGASGNVDSASVSPTAPVAGACAVAEPGRRGRKGGEGGGSSGKAAARQKGGLTGFVKTGVSAADASAAAFQAVEGKSFVSAAARPKRAGGKKRGRAADAAEPGEADDGSGSGSESLEFDDEADIDLGAIRAAHGKRRRGRGGRTTKAAASAIPPPPPVDKAPEPAVALAAVEEDEEDGAIIWPTGQ